MEPFMLNPESLTKILQMAGNQVETLEYLKKGLVEKTRKSGTEYAELIGEVTKLVDYAVSQAKNLNKLDPWSGNRDLIDKMHAIFTTSEFSAFQNFMADKLASRVPVAPITLDCEINDEAEFLRAYSVNGEVLQGEALEAMDILFNSWLAQPEIGMLMQNGVIHAGTEQGEIVKDVTSNAVKARADQVRELLSDPVRGFERYVQQKKTDAKIDVIQHQAVREEQAPSQ